MTTSTTSTRISTSRPSSSNAPAGGLAGTAPFIEFPFEDISARVVVTTRRAGDLRPTTEGAAERQQAVLPGPPWRWANQVHGAIVLRAATTEPGRDGDVLVGQPADRVSMFAADCILLGLVSPEGIVAAVHAGWQGLLSGVVEEAASAMRAAGASQIRGVRGPGIGPECYEFGPEDLDRLADRYGDGVRSETSWGTPALDLVTGVRTACARSGIVLEHELDGCTACERNGNGSWRWFSHRARRDGGRHALVVAPLP
jgi:copper oxidase (laccase) domain-containing protein